LSSFVAFAGVTSVATLSSGLASGVEMSCIYVRSFRGATLA
jgi:hypothetical protein